MFTIVTEYKLNFDSFIPIFIFRIISFKERFQLQFPPATCKACRKKNLPMSGNNFNHLELCFEVFFGQKTKIEYTLIITQMNFANAKLLIV